MIVSANLSKLDFIQLVGRRPFQLRRTDASTAHRNIPVLHSNSNCFSNQDGMAMTLRKFKIVQSAGDSQPISIKTKDPKEVLKLEPLVRKIFHNDHIVGATINYSNGHIVRIDLDDNM
jgi:hypothetical protein